ncbi:hypothetical protein IAU59_004495 [Kwoniella sp. CBS 9459]
MSVRTLLRSNAIHLPIALPSSPRPQFVNDEGFEFDPTETAASPGVILQEHQEDEGDEIIEGGEDVELVDEEVQVDEDVDMDDAEVEVEEAEAEKEGEEEAAPEPLLSVKDSLVLPYSLNQTRHHHLTSLLPHIFTHPTVPSHSRPRARPPPKGTFIFPTPSSLVHPLPAREYHGPFRTAGESSSSPGPSNITPDQADPSSYTSTPKGSRPKPKKVPIPYPDEIQPPAHDIECISRCTLSVGPISFPGAEIWIGRFVEPRVTVPKKERARPGERKERLKEKEEKKEKRKSMLADATQAAAKKAPRPRPSADGTSKRGGQPAKPRKSATQSSTGATATTVPAVRPLTPSRPPLPQARPPGVRPPPPPPGGPTSTSGPARPPRPPGTASGRPTASPQLIQLVNQAASRALWLSALIYKAAGSTANAEELERLGKAVARLSRGEPIEDLAPPGAVTAPAATSTGGPGPSTMAQAQAQAQAQARPPTTNGSVARPPGAVPPAARPPIAPTAVAPPVRPIAPPAVPSSSAAPTATTPASNPAANAAATAGDPTNSTPAISTTASLTPSEPAPATQPLSPAPVAVPSSSTTISPAVQPPPNVPHAPTRSTTIQVPSAGLNAPGPSTDTSTPVNAPESVADASTPAPTAAAASAQVNAVVPSAPASPDSSLTEVSSQRDDPESDEEVDMTGPKQVGGGPLPMDIDANAPQLGEAIETPKVAAQSNTDEASQSQAQPPPDAEDPSANPPSLPVPTPSTQNLTPTEVSQGAPVSTTTVTEKPRPIMVPFAEPSVVAPTQLTPASSMPPPTIIPAANPASVQRPTQAQYSLQPAIANDPSTVPASPSPLARAPSPTPPLPAPPKPTYPLPPAFILIAFKEQPTEKYLIPLGRNSFISRIGGDFVTGPPPAPAPAPEPKTEPTLVPVPQVESTSTPNTVPSGDTQGTGDAVPGEKPLPSSTDTPQGAAPIPHGIAPNTLSRNIKPLRSRTRQSLGRGAKEPPPPLASTATVTPPPVSSAVESAAPEILPEKIETPPKPRPVSGLPPLPGMQPPPGTILISTIVPSGKSRWEKVDWEKMASRLPFENPEFWDKNEDASVAAVKEEPKDAVSATTPSRVRPLRKTSSEADPTQINIKGQKPAKPDILNLGSEDFVPSSGDLQPLTIRLLDVEDSVWKKIKDVAEEVERTEIEAMFKNEPTLLDGIEVTNEDCQPTETVPVSETTGVPPVNPSTSGDINPAVIPSGAESAATGTAPPDPTPIPESEKVVIKRATLSERVVSILRPLYLTRKKARFTSLLSRVPSRAFLRTRLPPPPSQDLVEATTDKWAPRPYPISTKPLYSVDPDGDGDEGAANREIEFSPEPKNQRKRKANEKEETVTFEMPVSLEALDERVEEGAKRGIGRRGRGGRMSFGRNAPGSAGTSTGGPAEGEEDGVKKKKGKRGTEKGICEGCARMGLKVWRKGPNGRGTLCNTCGDLYVAGRLGPLKAPGAMKAILGHEVAAADEGDGNDDDDDEDEVVPPKAEKKEDAEMAEPNGVVEVGQIEKKAAVGTSNEPPQAEMADEAAANGDTQHSAPPTVDIKTKEDGSSAEELDKIDLTQRIGGTEQAASEITAQSSSGQNPTGIVSEETAAAASQLQPSTISQVTESQNASASLVTEQKLDGETELEDEAAEGDEAQGAVGIEVATEDLASNAQAGTEAMEVDS